MRVKVNLHPPKKYSPPRQTGIFADAERSSFKAVVLWKEIFFGRFEPPFWVSCFTVNFPRVFQWLVDDSISISHSASPRFSIRFALNSQTLLPTSRNNQTPTDRVWSPVQGRARRNVGRHTTRQCRRKPARRLTACEYTTRGVRQRRLPEQVNNARALR